MAEPRARIASLSLKDFRNFERLELEVPEAGLVLVGDNGQGKTNLLESAYYLSLLRSVRGTRDVDVARFGTPGFFVEAAICAPDAHRLAIGFERATRRKRVRRDGLVLDRMSDALGTLPAVMFSPGDVELVAGPASARRRFLDIMLALSSHGYLLALQEYRGALERRNAALRAAARRPSPGATRAIETWEGPLAEQGATILRARRAWVESVATQFADRSLALGERGVSALRYDSQLGVDDNPRALLADTLAARRESDLRHGLTSVGPHRDDVTLLLAGRELRAFGSAGQQRTAAIALRTLEAETLRDARGAWPVFLLDDPFAELDVRRATRVLALLATIGIGQTVLTVPRASDIPAELTALPRYRVAEGTVTQ